MILKVTIVVQDVNDNTPNIIINVLTASGSAEVRENVDQAGTFVAHLSAHDADSGAYGRVECQLSDDGAHLFRLESLYDDPAARYQLPFLVGCFLLPVLTAAILQTCIPDITLHTNCTREF